MSRFRVPEFLALVALLSPCLAHAESEPSPAVLNAVLAIAPLDAEISRSRLQITETELSPLPERGILIPIRLTSIERWNRFEVEFGIQETPATPIRYAVAKGVYHLNIVLFALTTFAQDIGSALHWTHSDDGWERSDYSEHRFSPTAPKSLFGKLNESQFKCEFGTEENHPYVALRWQIPFGK